MQNEYFSVSQSGPSDHSDGDNDQSIHSGFEITPEDSAILQGYLQEFQGADTKPRANILERVMAQLYLLRPPNSPFDKMDARKVCGAYLYMIARLILCFRKFRNGSTIITPALGVSIPNSLASGLAGMYSTSSIVTMFWLKPEGCLVQSQGILHSWVHSRMLHLPCGMTCLMEFKMTI
jgi:hypothetical protein